MYKIKCSGCEFEALSPLDLKLHNCPACSSKLKVSYKEESNIPNNLPKVVEQTVPISISECDLNFKELSYSEDEEVILFSNTTTEKITKGGFIYKEDYVNHEIYNVALLAKALILNDMPFLNKYKYLRENFSRQQIDLMHLRYSNAISSIYESDVKEELDKLIDDKEEQLMKLEELEHREEELKKRTIN